MKDIIELLFSFALILNAALFIPQAFKIYREKTAKGVSLISFCGFCFIQIVTVIHGYLVKDYILMFGFMAAFVTCATVAILIVCFKDRG